jgi:signal transduction histidine kinase
VSTSLPFRFGARLEPWLDAATAMPVAIALVLAAGAVDGVTGDDVTTNFLYLGPIFVGTWYRGRLGGFVVAALASVCRACTLAWGRVPEVLHAHLAWNTGAELVGFLVVVHLVDEIRRRAMAARTRMQLTTEQLRHAERLNTLGKLAAGVAHELGTPLNVIVGHAERVADGHVEGARARQAARTILAQSERMEAIVQQLLQFGRRGRSGRGRADLRAVARATVELLQGIARGAGVELEVDVPDAPLWTEMDPNEMEQVLANLALNAVQASKRGASVRIECGAGVDRGRNAVWARVHDEGEGIAAEHVTQVFDPFFTTKDVGQGTGLGLSIAYGIVDEHGGRIDVVSLRGKGSTFTVVLPAAGPVPAVVGAP